MNLKKWLHPGYMPNWWFVVSAVIAAALITVVYLSFWSLTHA